MIAFTYEVRKDKSELHAFIMQLALILIRFKRKACSQQPLRFDSSQPFFPCQRISKDIPNMDMLDKWRKADLSYNINWIQCMYIHPGWRAGKVGPSLNKRFKVGLARPCEDNQLIQVGNLFSCFSYSLNKINRMSVGI